MAQMSESKKHSALLKQLEKHSIEKPKVPDEDKMRAVFDRIMAKHKPAIEPREAPSYEVRVLAYMDVLGTTEVTRRSGQNRRAFFEAAGQFGTLFGFLSDTELQREKGRAKVIVSGFSDHVVISGPATGRGIREVLERAHDLYGRLLFINQRLPRGAVVVGDLYHEQNIIFGPALLDAYDLERRGGDPRIVATEEVVTVGGGVDRLRTGAARTRCPFLEKDGSLYYLHPLRTACASCRDEDFRYALQEKAKALLKERSGGLRSKGAWLAQRLVETSKEAELRRKA